MNETLRFPPLMQGLSVAGLDPFEKARAEALKGCEAGLILYDIGPDALRAAIVLAPEVPLEQAVAMLPACEVGLQNALGALAPPEVAVHLEWSGAIRLNGGLCGGFRAESATTDPAQVPDWLVVGFTLPLLPATLDTGVTPDDTTLFTEGCADVDPAMLLEAWARHTLGWINRWDDEGVRPLLAEWRGLLHGLGEPIEVLGRSGTFLGIDESFGMLLRHEGGTDLIPLTDLLEGMR